MTKQQSIQTLREQVLKVLEEIENGTSTGAELSREWREADGIRPKNKNTIMIQIHHFKKDE